MLRGILQLSRHRSIPKSGSVKPSESGYAVHVAQVLKVLKPSLRFSGACRCVVIEDSVIGLQAAKAAGMRCIVTKSRYTKKESFESADAIFDCIGDSGDERFSLDDLMSPGANLSL